MELETTEVRAVLLDARGDAPHPAQCGAGVAAERVPGPWRGVGIDPGSLVLVELAAQVCVVAPPVARICLRRIHGGLGIRTGVRGQACVVGGGVAGIGAHALAQAVDIPGGQGTAIFRLQGIRDLHQADVAVAGVDVAR